MKLKTLRKNSDFAYLKREGKRAGRRCLTVVCAKKRPGGDAPLVGYIASKRNVGNAVARNRAKRRLRALVRMYAYELNEEFWFLFIARHEFISTNFALLREEFEYSLAKALRMGEKNGCVAEKHS